MKNIKLILKDVGKIFGIGLVAAIIISIMLFVIGIIVGDYSYHSGIEIAKNGTLIISAIGLFLLAGMILTAGKKNRTILLPNSWRKQFYIIGYRTTIGAVCVAFILMATILDYIQMYVISI